MLRLALRHPIQWKPGIIKQGMKLTTQSHLVSRLKTSALHTPPMCLPGMHRHNFTFLLGYFKYVNSKGGFFVPTGYTSRRARYKNPIHLIKWEIRKQWQKCFNIQASAKTMTALVRVVTRAEVRNCVYGIHMHIYKLRVVYIIKPKY